VAHGTFITLYAANAVITEVSWQSKRKLPFNRLFEWFCKKIIALKQKNFRAIFKSEKITQL
jgi:hypothetical protein